MLDQLHIFHIFLSVEIKRFHVVYNLNSIHECVTFFFKRVQHFSVISYFLIKSFVIDLQINSSACFNTLC